ncbi:YadA-like family protein [Phyllobacterium sp. K27]
MSKVDITKVTATIFSPKAARFAGNWLAGAAESRSARRRLNAILRLACRVLGAKRRKGLGMLGVAGRAALTGVLTAFLTTGALAVDETQLGPGATANSNSSTAIGHKASATGLQSSAFGFEAKTNNEAAVAVGRKAAALGQFSTAIGNESEATGKNSNAIGNGSNAGGIYATAIGTQAIAMGELAQAIGAKTQAHAKSSVAIGRFAEVSDSTFEFGTAIGNLAKVTGINGVAIGLSVTAGANASAMGVDAKALGESSVAVGQAESADENSVAIGFGAKSLMKNSVAIGYLARSHNTSDLALGEGSAASGGNSTAIGAFTNTSGVNSAAFGYGAKASAESAIAIGRDAAGSGLGSVAIGSKVGITDDKGVTTTVAAPSASKLAIAIGADANASGENSAAVGFGAKSQNVNALALGVSSEASGGGSIAMGSNVKAVGLHSVAIGEEANTTGTDSIALGAKAKGSQANAVAIGAGANASGENSAAVGMLAKASAKSAIAIGVIAKATDASSVAIGYGAKAEKASDLALGLSSRASGGNSIAMGTGGKAIGLNSIAIGRYAAAGGADGLALGQNASANENNSVALGANSQTEAVHAVDGTVTLNGKDYAIDTGAKSVVSVGNNEADKSKRIKRQIINVAAGQVNDTSTDAVNGKQLNAAYDGIKRLGDSAVQYSVATDAAGNEVVDYTKVQLKGSGGTKISNVAEGVADTDAANVGQLKKVNQAATTLGNSVAKALGEGTTLDKDGNLDLPDFGLTSLGKDANGKDIAQPTTVLGGLKAIDGVVASQGTRLDTLQQNALLYDKGLGAYSASHGGATASKISNVAEGVADTDAVNKRQLDKVAAQANGTSGVINDSGDVISVGSDSDATTVDLGHQVETVDANGNKVTETKDRVLTGIADGSDKNDAVNKGQLDKVGQSVADALGEGTTLDKDGKVVLPKYELASVKDANGNPVESTTVLGDLKAIDGVVASQGARLDTAETDIDTLQQDALLYDKTLGAYSASHDNAKTSKISNVADGTADTDAVNKRQLDKVAAQANGTSGGINDSGDVISVGSDSDATTVDLGHQVETVDANGNKVTETKDRVLMGIADGSDKNDAVNKGQLDKVGQSVADALGEGTDLIDGKVVLPEYELSSLGKDASGNPVKSTTVLGGLKAIDGVVASQGTRLDTLQQDALLYDKGLGAYSASHGGTTTSKISNVAEGTADTDAANVGQLNKVDDKVTEVKKTADAAETKLTDVDKKLADLSKGTSGVIKDAGDVIAVGSDSDATKVDIGQKTPKLDASGNPVVDANGNPVMETKDRVLTGIADGVEKNDAVNKGQLDVVDNKVAEVKKTADAAETKLTGLTDDTVQKSIDTAATKVGQSVADALGGDAKLVDGKVVLPEYELTSLGKDASGNPVKSTTVLGGLKAIDGVVASQGTRLDTLQQDALLYDKTLGAFSASHGGTTTSKISNVAEGVADTDAANVGQLNKVDDKVTEVKKTADAAETKLTDVDKKLADLSKGTSGVIKDAGDVIAVGSDSDATKVDIGQKTPKRDASGNPVVDANGNPVTETKDRVLTGVADGVEKNDAVNKGQLDKVGQSVADALGEGTELVDGKVVLPEYELTSLGKDASGNPVKSTTVLGGLKAIDGVVASQGTRLGTAETDIDTLQQDALLYDKGLGAYSASHGTDKTSRISNVAEGTADTDAVNKGQLDKVAALANGTSGLIKDANGVIAVGSDSDATKVDLGHQVETVDANGNKVTETKDRVLTGIADGSDKNDAVNKGQLDVVDKRSVKYRWNDKNNNKIIDDGEIETTALMLEENQDKNGKPVGTRLGNVAGGVIDATSLEAVNGGQVHAAINSVAQSLGGGASVVNGMLSAPTFNLPSFTIDGGSSPMTFNNVGDALGQLSLNDEMFNKRFGQLKSEVDGLQQDALRWNKTIGAYDAGLASDQPVLSPSSDAGADGSGAPSRKKRSVASSAPTANAAPATTASTNRITGVADGRIAADSTDAINGGQLKTLRDDVADLFGDVSVVAAETNDRLESLEGNTVRYSPVGGANTNALSLKGGNPNAPVVISNLDEGQQDGDAVNVKQLNKVKQHADQQLEQQRVTSKAYTDQVGEKAVSRAKDYSDDAKKEAISTAQTYTDERIDGTKDTPGLKQQMANGFNQLSSDIASVRKEARQAAAIGLAASSLRFDSTPGKVSVAMGGGVWRDQGAFAFGAGYTSESGKVRANITGVTSGGQVGVGAGLSFTLN